GGPGRAVSPSAAESLCAWALDLGEPALALAAAEDWARQHPDDMRAIDARAKVCYRLGAWEQLARSLDRLIAKTPADANLFNRRTVAAYNQRIYSQAIAFSPDALGVDPANAQAQATIRPIGERLDALAAAPPYLREKVRLWQSLHLARLGAHRCAIAALPELPAEPPPRDGAGGRCGLLPRGTSGRRRREYAA